MILTLLLLVAIGGLSGAVLSSLRLGRTSEEQARADGGALALAGQMQAQDFDQLFRLYNESAADDPGGPGTAPGAAFDVSGLTPRADDPDGRVGRIVFPAIEVGGLPTLREDYQDARMGMSAGLDLNGDGDAVDDATNDYVVLPARLIVEWTGAGGNRTHELDLLLTE